MVEIGIAEYFSMGGALGIIGSLFVVLYLQENKCRPYPQIQKQKFSMIWNKECVKLLRLE